MPLANSVQHHLFNLQWRLQALENALEDLAIEVRKLLAEEALQGEQVGSKGIVEQAGG